MKVLYNQVRRYWWRKDEYAMPIIARYGTGGGNMPVILESNQNHATAKETEVCTTLPASMGMGGGYVPMVVEPVMIRDDITVKVDGGGVAFTLDTMHRQQAIMIAGDFPPGTTQAAYSEDNSTTYDKTVIHGTEENRETAVCIGNGQMCNITMKPIANTLDCMHDHQAIMKREENDMQESIVRRLTPKECCRLQGFPDSWVDLGEWVDEDGKTHKDADTPKYKALGNSIAVGFANERSGFWCWLMRRISAQYEKRPTMGSLFSGIEGFGLAFAAVNGPESVRWSSEVEQFPIAVIKKHFGDEDAGIKGDFYDAINGG